MNEQTRIRAGAAALAAAPALVLAGHLVQRTPAAHDTTSELASIAGAPTSYQVSGLLGFVAVLLFVPAFLTMVRPLWPRYPRLALAGVTMALAGVLGLASLMGSGPMSLALAQSDRSAWAVAVTDAYESSGLTVAWLLLMVVGYSLGPIVLGLGLWRSGLPGAVPVLLVVGLGLNVLDAGRWPLAAGMAVTWAGMALVAAAVWRGAGALSPAASPGGRDGRGSAGPASSAPRAGAGDRG